MPLVVDAFNVLHVTGVLPPDLAGLDLDGLAELVETTRFARDEAWIVCDGVRPPHAPRRRERVWFSWAGGGGTADDLIIGLVQRSTSPRRMTVVTSDRQIVKQVRRRGAETMTSEEFLERLVADRRHARPTGSRRGPTPRETLPLVSSEARAWLRIFGIDEAASAIEASAAPKAERPRPAQVPSIAPPEPTSARSDDPLAVAGIDMARLLEGTPPPRDGPRAPRRSRRDRRG